MPERKPTAIGTSPAPSRLNSSARIATLRERELVPATSVEAATTSRSCVMRPSYALRETGVVQLRRIEATRYVTPLREGGSLPALVEASDDGLYVLKFRGAG